MAVMHTGLCLMSTAVLLSPSDHVLVIAGEGSAAVGWLVKTGARGLRAVGVGCMEAVYCGLMVVQQNLNIGKLLWLTWCRRQLAGMRTVATVIVGIRAVLV